MPALLLALEPAVMFTAPVLEQVETAVPAEAVGAVVIVNVFVEVAFAQVPLPVAVKVIVTLPAVISAALGVYVAVVKDVAFANVPVPLEVQVVPALLLALEPAVIFTAPLFEQVPTAVPAEALGAVVMVKVLVEVAFAQVPLPVAVKVSVTLPAVMSAALGV